MWSIKKILYFNDKSGQSYLLLKKTKTDYKTEQSDLLRHWYTDVYDDPANLVGKKRFKQWLEGKNSQAIEDMVSNLRTPNQPPAPSYPDTIIVNGWLPSICPNVHYMLELVQDKSTTLAQVHRMFGYTDSAPDSYSIKRIVWINRMLADNKNMAPVIEYIASRISKGRREDRSTKDLRRVLKRAWKDFDWSRFTHDRYTVLWDVLGKPGHLIAPIDKALGNTIFASSFDPGIYSCLFGSTGSWAQLCQHPERLLLQGEHYNRNATLDDLKRLLLLLGRPIPDLEEIEDANRFIKALKRRTCLPIQFEGRTASTKYIQRSGEVWATTYDIENTAAIVNWFEGIPLHVGYRDGLVPNIPHHTPVFVKHVDDKLQWWSFMSYGHVTTEFPPDGDYIVGEAHHFSQEDWLFLSQQRKPLAIFGRKDILGARQRGHVFFDMVKQVKTVEAKPCLCENTETLTYEEACSMDVLPTQVYVSTPEDKRNCSNFPILKKMKRVWMNGPRRLCTETARDHMFVYIDESDGSENKRKKHRILDQKLYNGNLICTYESYQRVQTAVLIITEHTKPIDIYRVRSYTSEKVFLVEKGAGAPSVQYTPSNPLTLI